MATQSVPLHWIGRDRTGYYDLWQATIHTGPAGSLLTYRFDVHNGATDPDDRRPFIWDTTRWNRTVLRTTIRLIALRKRTSVLHTGSFVGLLTDDAHAGYAFGRWQAGQRAVVVLNDDRYTHTYQIPVAPVAALPGSRWSDAQRGRTVTTAAGDSVTVTLPAYSGTLFGADDTMTRYLVRTTP